MIYYINKNVISKDYCYLLHYYTEKFIKENFSGFFSTDEAKVYGISQKFNDFINLSILKSKIQIFDTKVYIKTQVNISEKESQQHLYITSSPELEKNLIKPFFTKVADLDFALNFSAFNYINIKFYQVGLKVYNGWTKKTLEKDQLCSMIFPFDKGICLDATCETIGEINRQIVPSAQLEQNK